MSAHRFILSAAIAFVLSALCHRESIAQEPQSFVVQGVKIHYTVAGKGETVVLIHGLLANADLNWKLPGIFSELAKKYQVIALDLPGHGRSDKPEKEAAYGLQLVEDIVLLLDHLKIKKAHIVGYSLGGMIAVKLMTKHPGRVLSATLGGMGWLREGSPLQKFWGQLPVQEKALIPSAFARSVGHLAVSEQELKKIAVPVKVIVGDRDPVLRLYVHPLQTVRPDWAVVQIKDAGHLDCVIKKEFREEVAGWLGSNSKR